MAMGHHPPRNGRPKLQAIRRAYRRAGFGPDTVAYFEGHGTGTNVGDATSCEFSLTPAASHSGAGILPAPKARDRGRDAREGRWKAAPLIGPAVSAPSKPNIGHTKAAAGIAGLIKARWLFILIDSTPLPAAIVLMRTWGRLAGPAHLTRGECWRWSVRFAQA